ncbi:solute carrier family 35 member E2A-like [Paramacrobiotus metropolitanus]|uniref:solute carrier family 35 member E2A-like n=1 Tax=Paramacrobiotus metropolitanus TaxID=2943436 RepID=UPI002445B88D|nr:solute carrier family 35 member E2A-like [Paramacrobiotus metropolitanus]
MDQPSEKPARLQELILDPLLHVRANKSKNAPRNLSMVRDVGIREPRVFVMLCLWYFFSGVTLFMNKFVLNALVGGSILLGVCQVLITTICSAVQLYFPCGMWIPVKQPSRPPRFRRNLVLVGIFRFLTIWFGLVALDYVAVSFAETVKCSAPIFTVIISRVITGEPATVPVVLSLIPVMTGLALCSAHELSFNLIGLIAALITNISEVFQSVFSKVLVSGDKHHCNPAELQFYSGAASLIFIIPSAFFFKIQDPSNSISVDAWIMIAVNGISFHVQSITANVLMGYLSPTTYSVSNTVKRALLIWCSILIFGNALTMGAWIGTGLMFIGVLLYNRAKSAAVTAAFTSD